MKKILYNGIDFDFDKSDLILSYLFHNFICFSSNKHLDAYKADSLSIRNEINKYLSEFNTIDFCETTIFDARMWCIEQYDSLKGRIFIAVMGDTKYGVPLGFISFENDGDATAFKLSF